MGGEAWRERGKRPGKTGERTQYTCPDCSLNAWAKPDVVLHYGACEVALEPDDT